MDKDGKRKKTQKFYVDFSDHFGRRHRLPGFAEKRATEALMTPLSNLVDRSKGSRRTTPYQPPERLAGEYRSRRKDTQACQTEPVSGREGYKELRI